MNRNVYAHPDGFYINYDAKELRLEAGFDASCHYVPIGDAGLIDLGLALVALGFELRNTKAVTQ